MTVHYSLHYREPEKTIYGQYICFGFMGSVPIKDLVEMRYYPLKSQINGGRWTNAHDKFVLALERLGINKVIPYVNPEARTPLERVKSGLRAEVHKYSAPMMVGAMEIYRALIHGRDYINRVAFLLDHGIAPKIAVFLPIFFAPGYRQNFAISSFPDACNVGYGMFDFWTKDHLNLDRHAKASIRFQYSGIHKAYSFPARKIRKKFKTDLTKVPESLMYSFARIGFSSAVHEEVREKRARFTDNDLLSYCRKMQNGRL